MLGTMSGVARTKGSQVMVISPSYKWFYKSNRHLFDTGTAPAAFSEIHPATKPWRSCTLLNPAQTPTKIAQSKCPHHRAQRLPSPVLEKGFGGITAAVGH